MTTLRKSTWNTYRITGYTHQVGDDARATGGVHLHQIRRAKSAWHRRTVDSNGRYRSAGPAVVVSDADGEAMYKQACRS